METFFYLLKLFSFIITTNKIPLPSSLSSTQYIDYLNPNDINFSETASNAQIRLNRYNRSHSISGSYAIKIGSCTNYNYIFTVWNASTSANPTSNIQSSTTNNYLIPYKILGYKL